MIIEKNTTSAEGECYEYPYYIAMIQRRFITNKIWWFGAQYSNHNFKVGELDNAKRIRAFSRLEEEGHAERFHCHFRFFDLARDAMYALGAPTIDEIFKLNTL